MVATTPASQLDAGGVDKILRSVRTDLWQPTRSTGTRVKDASKLKKSIELLRSCKKASPRSFISRFIRNTAGYTAALAARD